MIDASTRATAVPRAGSVPVSPVYQDTVFAAVPATRLVAVLNGGPPTRSGAGLPVTVAPKPSDANAAVFELVTVRFVPLPPCSVIAPPLMVEGFVVPVIESIFVNSA